MVSTGPARHSRLHCELSGKGRRFQAVLPGATATPFWDIAGLPVSYLPADIVMSAEDLVDAALSGLDMDEVYTVPALADIAQYDAYEAARVAMGLHLSKSRPAARYGIK